MDFTIELTDFPSVLHSYMYSYGRSIMPLRMMDTTIDSTLRESIVELHSFVMEMLSDMYDHPEAYHLPVMKLEEFLRDKELNEIKRQSPDKIKALFSQIENAVPQYMGFLGWIGRDGRVDESNFIISAGDLQKIGKKFKTNANPVSLEKRLSALNRVGLMTESSQGNDIRFTSSKYPRMFPAFVNETGSLKEPRKLTHDDYFNPLLVEQRERAYELHEFAMQKKLRIDTSNANGQLNYKYKSATVMSIGIERIFMRYLDVRIIGKDRSDEYTIIEEILKNESQDFQNDALDRMSGCDANRCINCSTFSSGNYVTILGKKHQMCGTGIIRFDWREPTSSDMAMIKRLIEIRCKNIDETQAVKKRK